MGKFDGILLATDWDGTVYYNGEITEENIRAINYFKENGGKFTICSGRYFEFLKQFKDKISPNTYTICYNGALIFDYEKSDVLYQGFCDGYIFEIIDKIIDMDIHYNVINFYDDVTAGPVAYTVDEYLSAKSELKKKNIYKVLLRTDTPEHGAFGAKVVNEMDLRDYLAVRSWEVSLEIMKIENSKGYAIKRLGEKISAKLIVAAGDYENDIELLKAADIGYAVENACDALKPIADRITVHAKDSAIAKIIYDIEKELK